MNVQQCKDMWLNTPNFTWTPYNQRQEMTSEMCEAFMHMRREHYEASQQAKDELDAARPSPVVFEFEEI